MNSSDRLKLLQLAMGEDEEDSAKSSRSGAWDPPPESELEGAFPGYRIEKLIAVGGMAAVYRALDEEKQAVAIKLMPPDFEADPLLSTRFESEMHILSGLNHKNIVGVREVGTTADGLRFIAMEFLPGGTLRGKRSISEAIRIVDQICEGLEHSHEKGVIHRDLKPSNILLTDNGAVKISDFGLAKETQGIESAPSLTLTGAQLGTPHYMAPEMLVKDATVDARSDLYSVGVILYQLLTGKIPVGHYEKASQLVRVPKSTDNLLNRAMAIDPEKRFQSVEEFRFALDRLRRHREIATRKIASIATVVILSGLIGILTLWFLTRPPDDPIIYSRPSETGEHLVWQSKRLWRHSPYKHEEWARQRDFSAGPGSRLKASINNEGQQVYFRGRKLILNHGSETLLSGSTGLIKAGSWVLNGGTIALLDESSPRKKGGSYPLNSKNLGARVGGKMEVESASQIVRNGPGLGPEIKASLSGSGPLIIGRSESKDFFSFSGMNRDYTGEMVVYGILRVDSWKGLGSGPITLASGRLWFPALPLKDSGPRISRTGPIEVSGIAQLVISRPVSVESLVINGEVIAPGNYHADSKPGNHPNLMLSSRLVVREKSSESSSIYLPKAAEVDEKGLEHIAFRDGMWAKSSNWNPPRTPRDRYTGRDRVSTSASFRIPEGRNMQVGSNSVGINYFAGRLCTLEQGGKLTFLEPGSTMIFPELHLEGGEICHRIPDSSSVLSATLAGNLVVTQNARISFGPATPLSEPHRLFLNGKLSGDGDIFFDGNSSGFLIVAADTAEYQGVWQVEKGGLGALQKDAFAHSTVILTGEESQLGAYRLPALRVKRVETQTGALVNPSRGRVWIDEWIHEGEAVPPGVYREHPGIHHSDKIVEGRGFVVVGYETEASP